MYSCGMVVCPIDNNETENELRRWTMVEGIGCSVGRLRGGSTGGFDVQFWCLRQHASLRRWAYVDDCLRHFAGGSSDYGIVATGCLGVRTIRIDSGLS